MTKHCTARTFHQTVQTTRKSRVSQNHKVIHPLRNNQLHNMCRITPQNKFSNQLLPHSLQNFKRRISIRYCHKKYSKVPINRVSALSEVERRKVVLALYIFCHQRKEYVVQYRTGTRWLHTSAEYMKCCVGKRNLLLHCTPKRQAITHELIGGWCWSLTFVDV
jgi:hypothetical protein